MAKYHLYSIRDVHNGFGLPLCDYNDHTAKRGFLAAVADDHFASAGDFDLYCIGDFDTESGVISPLAFPSIVARGTEAMGLHPSKEVYSDG